MNLKEEAGKIFRNVELHREGYGPIAAKEIALEEIECLCKEYAKQEIRKVARAVAYGKWSAAGDDVDFARGIYNTAFNQAARE